MNEEKQKEKKSIMQRRDELIQESIMLNQLAFDNNISQEESFKVRLKQDEIYKKYKWIDNFIKAERKIKK